MFILFVILENKNLSSQNCSPSHWNILRNIALGCCTLLLTPPRTIYYFSSHSLINDSSFLLHKKIEDNVDVKYE